MNNLTFTAVTLKGNQIQPHQTRRAYMWAVNTTIRSCLAIRTSTHAILLLNTICTIIARAIYMRLGNAREAKPKSYSRPRDLSRHTILTTSSPVDMNPSDRVYQNMPPSHLVQIKQKVERLEEQMQRTTKEKQKLWGGGNIRWWLAIKTRQDQDRSALRRPTFSGPGQHRRHPRRGCCYRSSRFQYPVVAR